MGIQFSDTKEGSWLEADSYRPRRHFRRLVDPRNRRRSNRPVPSPFSWPAITRSRQIRNFFLVFSFRNSGGHDEGQISSLECGHVKLCPHNERERGWSRAATCFFLLDFLGGPVEFSVSAASVLTLGCVARSSSLSSPRLALRPFLGAMRPPFPTQTRAYCSTNSPPKSVLGLQSIKSRQVADRLHCLPANR